LFECPGVAHTWLGPPQGIVIRRGERPDALVRPARYRARIGRDQPPAQFLGLAYHVHRELVCGRSEPAVMVGLRRIFPVPAGSGEGPFTEPTTAVQPWARESVLMPHTCRSQEELGPSQVVDSRPSPRGSETTRLRRQRPFRLVGMIPTCDPLVFLPGDGVSVDTVYGGARSGAKRCWNI
jgi:hypothetical protein